MKRRVISLLLALVLTLALAPCAGAAPASEAGEQATGAAARIDRLLEVLAAGYTEAADNWTVLDMGAYALAFPETASRLTAGARQAYVDTAIAAVSDPDATDAALAKAILGLRSVGVDPTHLTTVNRTRVDAVERLKATATDSLYSAPYVLLACRQGDYGTEARERQVVELLLEQQNSDGGWGFSHDTAGEVLAALAAYRGDPEVDAAVRRAVAYLEKELSAAGAYSGGFSQGDSNATAMVAVGLAAVGVDPATVRNGGKSVAEGLLSFALADDSGFGYADAKEKNASATEQSFRALVALSQTMGRGGAYNVYDFTANPAAPGVAATAGGSGVPGAPASADRIAVTFTLRAGGDAWIPATRVETAADATVYHVFTQAMDRAGFAYTGAEAGYVVSVTSPAGDTLSEFDQGPNSGWLYQVNGVVPDVGMTACGLSNGDDLLWYYTGDWAEDRRTAQAGPAAGCRPRAEADGAGGAAAAVTAGLLSDALAEALASGGRIVTVAPQVPDRTGRVTVELPAAALAPLAAASVALEVRTGLADVGIPAGSLPELAGGGTASVSIRTETEGAVRVEIAVDGASVERLTGGLLVTLPAADASAALVPVLVDAAGGETAVWRAAPGDRGVTARLDGPATLALRSRAKTFPDVPAGSAWADPVAFAAAQGLFLGTAQGRFDPDGTLSGAMLATVLCRLEGAGPQAAGEPWYAAAVAWARERGAVEEDFDPAAPVTWEALERALARCAGDDRAAAAAVTWASGGEGTAPVTRGGLAAALQRLAGLLAGAGR